MNTNKITTKQLTKIALSAALYFVVTMACKPFALGPIEFRLSEMFNFLMFLDPVYIIGVTLGCALSNFFTFGLLDVFVGAGTTFIVGCLMWKSKHMWTGIIYATLGSAAIAWELWLLFGMPFWIQFGLGATSELGSMILGYIIARRLFKNKKLVEMFKATPANNKNVINVK